MTRPSLGKLWGIKSSDTENLSPSVNVEMQRVVVGAGELQLVLFLAELQITKSTAEEVLSNFNTEPFKPCSFFFSRLVARST